MTPEPPHRTHVLIIRRISRLLNECSGNSSNRILILALVAMTTAHLRASEAGLESMPARGLIAYYPFDGNAMDESGNGNHAHPDGTVAATDKFGNFQSAYFFDGEKSSMTAPVCIVPDVMPRVTIVAWARADQQDRPATVISNADTHPTGRSLQMRPSPSKGTSWATSTNNLGSDHRYGTPIFRIRSRACWFMSGG